VIKETANPVVLMLIKVVNSAMKYVFLIYIAKTLTVQEVGVYGLIVSTLVIVVQFVGFEYNLFNAREILSTKIIAEKGEMIKDQFALHITTYPFAIVILLLLFILEVIPWQYILIFYCLMIVEHLSQEIFRILVVCFKPVTATILQFIRSAGWIIPAILLIHYGESEESINFILYTWLLGSLISVLAGWYYLNKLFSFSLRDKINYSRIKKGIKSSFPFLLVAGLYSIMIMIDRFIIDYYYGKSEVGIYFFYVTIASAFHMLLTYAVAINYGPRCLETYQENGVSEYIVIKKEFKIQSIKIGIILAPFFIFGIYAALFFVDIPAYKEHIDVFWFLFAGVVIQYAQEMFHLDLYVRRMDIEILKSVIIVFFLTLIVQIFLIKNYALIGAAIGVIFIHLVTIIIKYIYLAKSNHI
jgi:O-antigen/teichoic acid export membrane protein